LFQCVGDSLKDFVYVRNDFVIPDSKYAVSRITDKLRSTFVFVRLVCVVRAIELDNKLCFETEEVCDEWSDRVLAAEFESFELSGAQA